MRLGNRERRPALRPAAKTSAGDLAGIHISSLVIHGSDDRIVPVAATRARTKEIDQRRPASRGGHGRIIHDFDGPPQCSYRIIPNPNHDRSYAGLQSDSRAERPPGSRPIRNPSVSRALPSKPWRPSASPSSPGGNKLSMLLLASHEHLDMCAAHIDHQYLHGRSVPATLLLSERVS